MTISKDIDLIETALQFGPDEGEIEAFDRILVRLAKAQLPDCFEWFLLSKDGYCLEFESNYGHLKTVDMEKIK